ncbi:MAG: choice-of-anchor Q domain-containing protein [Phycisphaerales bacterium]
MNRVFLGLVAMVVVSTTHAGTVLRVDDDASAAGDGSTWATAYRFLQDALIFASNPGNGVTIIRVAQGTYVPDRDEANAGGTGDRETSFDLLDGVAIEGGYAGIGTPDPDARDIVGNETILSGDLLGDDGPDFTNNDENSHHVVSAVLVDTTALLDGVTITAGNADGGLVGSPLRDGAGIWIVVGTPVIKTCTIRENRATFGGGMAVVNGGDPTLIDCSFAGNVALDDGGGLHVDINSTSTLRGCLFTQNETSTDDGGGIYTDGAIELVSCDFVDNAANASGGGVRLSGLLETPSLIVNCRFSGNSANHFGGGLLIGFHVVSLVNSVFHDNTANGAAGISAGSGELVAFNCTIVGNTALTTAGGLAAGFATSLQNCILWANTPDQIISDKIFPLTTLFCNIQDGWPGGSNTNVDPMFINEPIGDLRLQPGSPCIDAGLCVPLPSDAADLDSDGDFAETFPQDIDAADRIVSTAIDLGAYEYQGPFGRPGDVNRDGLVGITDFLSLLAAWGPCCPGDLNVDGVIDATDLDLIVALLGPCPPGPCPADLNGDGEVGVDDLQLLAGSFGICDTCPADERQAITPLIRACPADVNGDGIVGITDFLTLLANWD